MKDEIITKIKEVVVPKKKTIDAEGAYTLSKYGQRLTEDEVYHRSINDIGNLITIKSQNGGSSILYEFDYTFASMKSNLTQYFTELGYLVIVIDESISKDIKTPKLFISWEK